MRSLMGALSSFSSAGPAALVAAAARRASRRVGFFMACLPGCLFLNNRLTTKWSNGPRPVKFCRSEKQRDLMRGSPQVLALALVVSLGAHAALAEDGVSEKVILFGQ